MRRTMGCGAHVSSAYVKQRWADMGESPEIERGVCVCCYGPADVQPVMLEDGNRITICDFCERCGEGVPGERRLRESAPKLGPRG